LLATLFCAVWLLFLVVSACVFCVLAVAGVFVTAALTAGVFVRAAVPLAVLVVLAALVVWRPVSLVLFDVFETFAEARFAFVARLSLFTLAP
jgi:hypothetical protein